MTLTLRHFSSEQETTLREIFEKMGAMGDRLGGWYIDKATVNRKSAALYLKWDNDVSPLANQDLQSLFAVAPSALFSVLGQLLDAPGWAEKPDADLPSAEASQ